MTSTAKDSGTRTAKSRVVPCLALLLGLALLLPGCLRLDSFLFEPTQLDGEYFETADMDSSWHVHWVIPDSLVEPCTLAGLDGNKVYAFFARQPSTDDRARTGVAAKDSNALAPIEVTVIYNHGRGENINRYWGRVELLWEAGCNVFIYDYEGFGKSEGTPSGEACYADARAALSWVRDRGVPDSSIVLYAWSLGSFMACHLAADVSGFAPRCLILENPMASTSALAKEGMVLGVPGSFLADADFDNETRIPLVGCRTLIIYGEKDDTAVPERNALVLLDKADPLATTGYPVPNANHSDVPETMGYEEYERVVWEFIAGGSF
jgi:pimeloyl-ACP methyl ester carboxylesterase